MTYLEWPSGVSYRSEQEYWKGKPYRAPLKTDMDGGNVRVRRRPGDKVGTYGWGRRFTETEMGLFISFFEDDLNLGTAKFIMPVSLYGYAYTNRVVQIVGDSIDLQTDGMTATTFSLDVYPASMLP